MHVEWEITVQIALSSYKRLPIIKIAHGVEKCFRGFKETPIFVSMLP